MRCSLLQVLAVLVLAACGPPPDEKRPELPDASGIRADLTGVAFDEFLDRSFKHLLRRSPESVIDLGLDLEIGKSFLDDVSDPFTAQTREIEATLLDLLHGYDRASLTPPQQRSYDVYEWWLDDRVRDHAFEAMHYRVSPTLTSVTQNTELFFTDVHPVRTEDEARSYVARLRRVAGKLEDVEGTLQRQELLGIVLPQDLNSITRQHLGQLAGRQAESTPYFVALSSKLAGFDPNLRRQLLDEARELIETSVQPAYASLNALLARQAAIAPVAIGVGTQPNGQAFYAHALRHHVTTPVTADGLHALGLSELSRIHADLRARFDALGYPGTLTIEQGLARARTEGGFVNGAQVVASYEQIISETEPKLGEAFDLFPSAEVVVKGVPSGGFYVSASLDGSRPGAFFATVGGGEARLGMRTLAYHEAIPGHHLQLGIAQDLPLPLFQRVVGFTGFIEGWALYAEWLAGDLGWYAGDPYGDIGRLQAEAFRAARLVVDTGIHAKGWSLEQAIAFFRANVGYSEGAARGQLIRYASWPGQATAYMTGSLEVRALRTRAEEAKGAGFDLKAFHRAVLSHGSLPLEVMKGVVAEDLQLP